VFDVSMAAHAQDASRGIADAQHERPFPAHIRSLQCVLQLPRKRRPARGARVLSIRKPQRPLDRLEARLLAQGIEQRRGLESLQTGITQPRGGFERGGDDSLGLGMDVSQSLA
jgi:hypothetical protein